MILMDLRVELQEIAEAVGISVKRVTYILNVEFGMVVSARWMTRLLGP